MSALHRTLVLAFIAGCSAVGCLASTEVDHEPSGEASEPVEGAVCDTAPEGSDIALACPAGEVITAVEFASYGTPRGVCGSYRATSCNAPTSKAVVERACLGQSSCTVRANNATFGDPCRRATKRMYVQVACAPADGGSTGTGTGGSTGTGTGTGGSTGTGTGTGGSTGEGGSTGVGGSTGEGGSTGTGGETCGGAGPSTTPLDAEEQAFLSIINQYRAQNGLGALTACTALSRASQGHSEDMRDRNYFDHASQDGRTPWDRAANACYASAGRTSMAENIAAGKSAAQATFDQWKNSDGHNKNMLGSSFKVIGIGRATGGGTYGSYWTTMFGGASDASCN
ncbi:CAP domain-containing protein [Sorangium sp. So ce861]|uniref:CAP domain-containing protein n=1 Tax=Sorangium sp. So ce861 TaxID=3133323 RepID=UPI003F632388